MDDSLFRKEALAHARRRLPGAIVIANPLSLRVLSIFALLILVLCAGVLAFVSYPQRTRALGLVTSDGGLVSISSPAGGVVTLLPLPEGATIQPGSVIASLSMRTSTSEGSTEISGLESLDAQIAMHNRLSRARMKQADFAIAALEVQRAESLNQAALLEESIVLQTQQIEALEAEIEKLLPVAERGFISIRQLDARKAALLAARATLVGLRSERSGAVSRARQLQDEIWAAQAGSSGTAAEAGMQAAILAASRAGAVGAAGRNVLSEKRGRLLRYHVREGQSVFVGDPLATVSQGDQRALYVDSYLSSRQIGPIHVDQPAEVSVQLTGGRRRALRARVTLVATAASPRRTVPEQLQSESAGYLVRLALQPGEAEEGISPGLLVDVAILSDRRSLLDRIIGRR